MLIAQLAVVVVHERHAHARRDHHHGAEQAGCEHHRILILAHQSENQHEAKRHRTDAHHVLA